VTTRPSATPPIALKKYNPRAEYVMVVDPVGVPDVERRAIGRAEAVLGLEPAAAGR